MPLPTGLGSNGCLCPLSLLMVVHRVYQLYPITRSYIERRLNHNSCPCMRAAIALSLGCQIRDSAQPCGIRKPYRQPDARVVRREARRGRVSVVSVIFQCFTAGCTLTLITNNWLYRRETLACCMQLYMYCGNRRLCLLRESNDVEMVSRFCTARSTFPSPLLFTSTI